jgi:hypothetical protein
MSPNDHEEYKAIPRLAFRNQAAGLLFISAKEAAKRAYNRSGTLGEQNEVMNTIILCVVVLEAAINDISAWHEFNYLRPPYEIGHGMPHSFEKMELRTKWSLFPMIVRHRTFDFGSEPWQSFDALVELRNYIVHLNDRAFPKRVGGLLEAKKLISPIHWFLGFEIAKWVCETVADLFDELTKLIEPPEQWISHLWLWTPKYFPRGLSTPGDKFHEKDK